MASRRQARFNVQPELDPEHLVFHRRKRGEHEIMQVSRFGPDALNVVFRGGGSIGEALVYRDDEANFESVETGRSCDCDASWGDGFRLSYRSVMLSAVSVEAQ